MGLRINQNIEAMNAYRNLSVTQGQMSKSLEKLSSGFRINRAADDAAGLSISEGLRAQIGGLKVAVRNAQDGVNVVQTADGALTEVHSILQRMRDLAVQASNTGSQDLQARQAAQTEFDQLNQELTRIGDTTRFGGQTLLKGTAASVTGAVTGGTTGALTVANFTLSGVFDVPGGTDVTLSAAMVSVADGTYSTAGSYQSALQNALDATMTTNNLSAGTVKAAVSDQGGGVWKVELSTTALDSSSPTFTIDASTGVVGVGASTSTTQANAFTGTFQIGAKAGEKVDVQFQGVSATILGTSSVDLVNDASAGITAVDAAVQSVSTTRANLGAYQNRFEHTINNLNVAVQNLSASESQIRDTDMAQEMTQFTRAQILQQAGTAMLAQANQAPQSVLQLLR